MPAQYRALATKTGLDPDRVARQLPDTFWVEVVLDDDRLVIAGNDFGQWTFNDYVRPNLAQWGVNLDEIP